jgi:hypothetical protein
MSDVKITGRSPSKVPSPLVEVATDRRTIVGNGTARFPLRAIQELHAVVHDTSLVGDGTTASPLSAQAALGFEAINGDVIPMAVGMTVAVKTANTVLRATASSQAFSEAIGLVSLGAGQTLPIRVQSAGPLELTAAQWMAVTEEGTPLVPTARYYLSTTPGLITTTPPSSSGTSLVQLGTALDSTVMILKILSPILN